LKYVFTQFFHEFLTIVKLRGYNPDEILNQERPGTKLFLFNSNLFCVDWPGTSVFTEKFNGTYKYACGSSYKGDWENGKRHGKGVLKLDTGDIYNGDFVQGRRHGFGVFSYYKPIRGVVYKGEWYYNNRIAE